MAPWLSIVGIGEDGWPGLNPVARSLAKTAGLIFGGKRHLDLLPPSIKAQKIPWASPLDTTLATIPQHRGKAVCVLASGDPMCYGIGVTLTRLIPISEITIIPHLSAFSLACARLGWPLMEIATLSLCGRDIALLNAYLYPQARLLILSSNQHTPQLVAAHLSAQGWGKSQLTVLERLGGSGENIRTGLAATWQQQDLDPLNTLAVLCVPDTATPSYSRLPGLPDCAYTHDGQLTKKEVRAVTLSALAPLPGQLLWDVGAGCGSISIEWLRSDRRCRAIAIEHHPQRLQYIAANALALGVPELQIIPAQAPGALHNLPSPDTIFIGGGLTTPSLLETCWQALPRGGKLVVNGVTVESEQTIFTWQTQIGGNLTRIAIQRAAPLGKFLAWQALAPVTQWVVVKS